MTRIVFHFPGGRYHATPWGYHVNEGLVEWPPGPWRLLRAFIATAFTKLGVPDPVPPEHPLRRLIAALATKLPSYTLPQAIATHSRHYMPLGGKGGKTTLVLDTCAVVDDGVLAVAWPVDLDPECHGLLSRIAASMGYLGRAESWVDATLLADMAPMPPGTEAVPLIDAMARGPGWEQVPLLAPVSAPEFALWRTIAAPQTADIPVDGQPSKGRKPAKSQAATAMLPYPDDLFDCLTRDTAWLQKYGWSQPPGSRRALYWRRADSLATTPPRFPPRHRSPAPVEAALLALASDNRTGDVLPLFSRCVPQAELLHRALVGIAGGREGSAPSVLTGKDVSGSPLEGHRHLHILPLCLDRDDDRFLDHVLLWAPMGLDARAQRALLDLHSVWTKGADDLRVTIAGMGALASLGSTLQGGLTGPARVWQSRTPFVSPRFLKRSGTNTLQGQVRAELLSRGLPLAEVEVLSRDEVVARHFHRFVRVRRDAAKGPPQDCFHGLLLTFAEPVLGPICLGYASHFGLGLFATVD